MYLFSINTKGTAVLYKEAVQLCPVFKKLDEKEILFLILAYDNYSPFRQLSEDERIRRAKAQVYGAQDIRPWEIPTIKEAIEEYVSLQYNPLLEQRKTYQEKIEKINDGIRDADSPAQIKNLLTTNKELRKELEQMDKELLMQEEEESIEIYGKGSLSWLERAIRNKKRYKEMIVRKVDDISKRDKNPVNEEEEKDDLIDLLDPPEDEV